MTRAPPENKRLLLLKKGFHIYLAVLIMAIAYYTNLKEDRPKNFELTQINQKSAQSLQELVKTKFFKIIRINVETDCPFWAQVKMCGSGSCTVCRCDEKDIPLFWTKTDPVESATKGLDQWSDERNPKQEDSNRWIWHVEDVQNDKGEYFDVDENKEAYTGYNGQPIWSLIYNENCFSGVYQEMCKQQKILYQIISGLHASISTHLSYFYKDLDPPGMLPRPPSEIKYYTNKVQYMRRVGNHPERVENLYFLYKVLLTSVLKVKDQLLNYTIDSNNIESDLRAKVYLKQFIDTIDSELEGDAQLNDFIELQSPFVDKYQRYIHNISRIMNCVECEKCRLFGKMQTYGLGTAMKIMFGYDHLKRNELVALLNTLNKISMSVKIHRDLVKSDKQIAYVYLNLYGYMGTMFFAFLWVCEVFYSNLGGKIKRLFKHVMPSSFKTD